MRYVFEASGSYAIITQLENGEEKRRALPAGRFSVVLHAANDGRISIVDGVKAQSEVSNSIYELSLYYYDIISPACGSANDAVLKLSSILAGAPTDDTSGTSIMPTAYELQALASLEAIAQRLDTVIYLLKSIAK